MAGTPDVNAGAGSPDLGVSTSDVRTARMAVTVAAGATEEHTVSWSPPFTDTNYTATVAMETGEGTLGSSLRIRRVSAHVAASVTVVITNDDGINPLSGTVHAIAVHDG